MARDITGITDNEFRDDPLVSELAEIEAEVRAGAAEYLFGINGDGGFFGRLFDTVENGTHSAFIVTEDDENLQHFIFVKNRLDVRANKDFERIKPGILHAMMKHGHVALVLESVPGYFSLDFPACDADTHPHYVRTWVLHPDQASPKNGKDVARMYPLSERMSGNEYSFLHPRKNLFCATAWDI